jgi:hypothetical protein
MICSCGHQDWHHLKVAYPAKRNPCRVCVKCGGNGKGCCLTPQLCRCSDFEERRAS